MNIINNSLVITRDELINMIKNDNPDKKDWSKKTLINIINNFKYFSDKQYNWIFEKIKYIVVKNVKYKQFRGKYIMFEIDDSR